MLFRSGGLLLPGGHDQEQGDGAHGQGLGEAEVGDLQQAPEHEGLELAGHVPVGQQHDHAHGEEPGEDDGGLGTPWVQGSMNLRQPYALELEYVQRMMGWMLLAPDLDDAVQGHAMQSEEAR